MILLEMNQPFFQLLIVHTVNVRVHFIKSFFLVGWLYKCKNKRQKFKLNLEYIELPTFDKGINQKDEEMGKTLGREDREEKNEKGR